MRKLLLGVVIILIGSMFVGPTLAEIVSGGGTIEGATFGGTAMSMKSGQEIGQWTHNVAGAFIFQGDVNFLAISYFSPEAYFGGSGRYNGEEGYTFEVLVRDDDIDQYHITIYDSSNTEIYDADEDLTGGNIILLPATNGHPRT
jgi:hypothetical protein